MEKQRSFMIKSETEHYRGEEDIGLSIQSLTLEELKGLIAGLGEKPYRAKQLYSWMHVRQALSYDEMTNLPKAFRKQLALNNPLTVLHKEVVQESKLDGTRKYLFALYDGNMIESVLMHYHFGNSVCISSQVGCNMGCSFCASTVDGCVRSLTAAEMLGQIYAIARDSGEKVSHVVVMGSGEPLENFDNLIRFIQLLTDENGMHLSQRSVTVSTCGLAPQIRRLADQHLKINLAISLHSAIEEKRRALMPIARRYPLPEVMDACAYYFHATGRQLTFEYALIAGQNDREEDVAALVSLLKDMHATVNLIPLNPVRENSFAATDRTGVLKFQKKLEKSGINVTIRREMGRDIDGACGQLRRRYRQDSTLSFF